MSTKRAIELASKLQFEQNERLRAKIAVWVSESKDWASCMVKKYGLNEAQKDEEGYRLLYVLNHLCPSLHHFYPVPNPKRFGSDIAGYTWKMEKHFLENTQVGLQDENGLLIQEGVVYNAESFAAFLAEAAKYCDLKE